MKGRHEQAGKIVSNSNHPQAEVSDLDSLGHRPSLPSIRSMFPSAFTPNATAGEGGGPRADYAQYHGGQQQPPSGYPSYPSHQQQQQYYGEHNPQMQQQQPQSQSQSQSYGSTHRSPTTAATSPHEGSHLSYPYPSAAPAHYLPSHMPNQAPSAPAAAGVMLPPRNTSAGNAPAPTPLPMPPSSTPAGAAYSPYESHGPRSPTASGGGHSTHTFSATPSSIPNAPPIQQPHHPHPSASPHHHHHPHQQLPLRDGPMFIRLGTTASGSLEVNARSDNPRGLSSVQSTWIDPKESGTGGARHVCELCHRTFDRPSTLRTHMNAHTGSKPYLCSKCGRGFGASSNMRRHERSCREAGPGQSPQSPGSNAST